MHTPDWRFPYPSQRMPVLARNVVATSQPLATQAGMQALAKGGNAIDAVLAAAITLTVVEPNNNGVGSDAFAQVWDGQALHGLNASGRAPAGWHAERFRGRSRMPQHGWDSVTVPGAVSAWLALSERFGRLPFADLFSSAIHYAEQGFHVAPKTAFYWPFAVRQFEQRGDFMAHFAPRGRAPHTGELFRRPDLAHTLADIAATRTASFYRGALAERMVAHSQAEGGAMELADLADHRCDWVQPIGAGFADVRLHEIPPNGQGLAALIAARVLDVLGAPGMDPDSVDAVHLQVEAMKLGVRAAFRWFADPAAMAAPAETFLDPQWIAELARGIDRRAASEQPLPALPMSHDTVYLAAADADGRMVSYIQSNYRGFGSGVVVPGTGIAMQNRGSGFVLDPAHPNCVGPRKRPYHTIIPGFVTRTDAAGTTTPVLAFGVMGGHMQPQGHLQMLMRICGAAQNPQAASDAPRWHVYEDLALGLEQGWPTATLDALAARGHRVRIEPLEHVFGGAQIIQRLEDGGYCAASDSRKEGHAAGL
jgi:gamma-glutamyltranspeptidase/glutathione hydrolase